MNWHSFFAQHPCTADVYLLVAAFTSEYSSANVNRNLTACSLNLLAKVGSGGLYILIFRGWGSLNHYATPESVPYIR